MNQPFLFKSFNPVPAFLVLMNLTHVFAGNQAHAISTPNQAQLESNKKLVKDFYALAFNEHRAKLAAEKYLNHSYLQHNPHVASGREAFIKAFASESANDQSKSDFIRVVAEGDLVVLHSHKIPNPGQPDRVGVDIFRIEDGKIAEHWDVNQDIPKSTVSGNSVY